jgi:hypothetical protein
MSYKILGPAWEANLSCPAKLILISLADQANDHGICWPSVQTMISRTGLCDRAVRGHLADLESAGHITRDFRSGRSTVYRIHPIATPAKECTPEKEFRTAPHAGLPLHHMQDTPAPHAGITVIEPKGEPQIVVSPSPKQKRKSARRGYPEDFFPNETGIAFANERKLDIKEELVSFENFHRAKGDTMADWQAAWRTWCMKAVKFRKAWPAHSIARDDRAAKRQEVLDVLTGRAPRVIKDVFSGNTIEGELL